MLPPQPLPVRCPQCQQTFNAPVQTIIDVGLDPRLKAELLGGRLNVVTCPKCGARVRMGTPLFYHDPAHELAIAFVPLELGMARDDQEKFIGRMSNALMDALPPEKRRFYILNPKTTLTMQGLLEMVLEKDGITREMIEAQAARAKLVTEMLNVVQDDEKLAQMVDANRASIDYDFYLLIAEALEDAQMAGDELRGRRLAKLRDRLIALTGGPASQMPTPLAATVSVDELIKTLLETEPSKLVQVVAVNRPRFDYAFFQTLTGQIEAAEAKRDTDQAKRLTDLREAVLDAAETVDREMQASLRQGAHLLQTILNSGDPQQTIQDHLDEIDDAFLLVLSANIQQAHDEGQQEVAQALEGLYAYVLSRLELELPPQLQMVNRLLRLADPAQRAEALSMEESLVNEDLAEMLEQVAEDAESQNRHDLAQHARTVRDEVRARL